MSEQDWLNLLLGSPLFDTVNKIEEIVKNGSGDAGIAGAKGGRPYIDIKVGEPFMMRGRIKTCSPNFIFFLST